MAKSIYVDGILFSTCNTKAELEAASDAAYQKASDMDLPHEAVTFLDVPVNIRVELDMGFVVGDSEGNGVARFAYAEDAAMYLAVAGHTTISYHGKVVWREGQEETTAAESYDTAAEVMNTRAGLNRTGYNRELGVRS